MWNNKRTVTSLPSAFRLLTSRRGEQICAPVQRKVRHAALSPGSHFGTSPSVPVPRSGVGGDSRLLLTSLAQAGVARVLGRRAGGCLHRGAMGGDPSGSEL